MTRPARFARHLPLADTIARDYRLPGADSDDVQQEARIGLWIAARNYEADRGASFPTFARLVIKRRLSTLLQAALRHKQAMLTGADRDVELAAGPDVERVVVDRDMLARLVAAARLLTPLEREGLAALLNGERQDKRMSNALYSARRKLREAA